MELVKRRDAGIRPFGRLRQDMTDLFGRIFEDLPVESTPLTAWWPPMDVSEEEDRLVLSAELPGVRREDLDISVQENVLTLTGAKTDEREEKTENYYYAERRYGTFRRSIQLPCAIDAGKVEADLKDGVLRVILPRTPEAKALHIAVKGAPAAKAK